ncbi:MBOAT family protein [Pontibacter sp. G13]|uniref:MBOAT family O-acyltransferase n=1 Tax=Pontibacter sp. G13 TaxID=3074898 RepID=UPI00288A1360|nr:MBOAT family protein [Pontibacter sp. G13]WNJ18136.1 MBOAT family protein [Pontibacter sp. G13]
MAWFGVLSITNHRHTVMLFNSIEFGIFLPIVFALYWGIGKQRIRAQNLLLLGASYLFYGWWDARFLLLIALSSVVDFGVARAIYSTKRPARRKWLVGLSLAVNLGLLGFFKYYNFFLTSFVEAFTFFGNAPNIQTLSLILPVGISFYTFQTLSYTIDVYRGKLKPSRNLITFLAYVSFFPQLVAGPIERATNLLPQFAKQRSMSFESGRDGLRLILWGLFKKVVIADTCAIYANEIFQHYGNYSSPILVLGAVYFAFQIYGDFSGYSDIAIGTAKLFGFDLMTNFRYPYFSRDIAEFWRRWHISLSTWFRDYLYIPLGGSRGGLFLTIVNVMIIFVVSGFWHGANWTFIVWGALNGLYFIPVLIMGRNRQNLDTVDAGRRFPRLSSLVQIGLTFGLTMIAWVFFRAESLTHAWGYLSQMAAMQLGPIPWKMFEYMPLVALLVVWEWIMRERRHGLDFPDTQWMPAKWGFYVGMVFLTLYHAGGNETFIYFQF